MGEKRQGESDDVQDQKRLRLDVGKAKARLSNVSVRDLMGSDLFVEAVLDL